MRFRELFDEVKLTKVKWHLGVVDTEWEPKALDREAAWELYVEMITRIVIQPLPAEHGDEKTALDSVFALFGITREILRRKGRDCIQFTKVAVVVLNQIVRPFTARWHRRSLQGTWPIQPSVRCFGRNLPTCRRTSESMHGCWRRSRRWRILLRWSARKPAKTAVETSNERHIVVRLI